MNRQVDDIEIEKEDMRLVLGIDLDSFDVVMSDQTTDEALDKAPPTIEVMTIRWTTPDELDDDTATHTTRFALPGGWLADFALQAAKVTLCGDGQDKAIREGEYRND